MMLEEYNRVVAEVDLDAIEHNVNQIKNLIGREKELMAVVKADGYGHGVFGICDTLVQSGVDRLAVAIIDEGKQLRRRGIKLPILILGYTPESRSDEIVEYDLIQTVFTYKMAEKLSESAVKLNKIAKIHIKIDTGMGRIGFLVNKESIEVIEKISKLPNIELEGIFTHFSKADEIDKDFSYTQLSRFTDFVNRLENIGISIPVKHLSNSAAIIDLPSAHSNLVRAGIILYGLYPSKDVRIERLDLHSAMALKAHVIFVKDVEAGTHISYGGTYVTKAKRKIATIPVGYGDGYNRLLSSKGKVLIKGQYAPIVGRVCMDQFMVDVTDIEDVNIGDEVILFGRQGDNEITAGDIADLIGTIEYEVICMIGKRVPRIYKRNNKIINKIHYF